MRIGAESDAAQPAEAQRDLRRRLDALVRQHTDFVWRSLRSLGITLADCDDGCQRVWLVVASKAASIEHDKERSFIFSVLVRVAADMRRSRRRRPVELDEDALEPVASASLDAEAELERQRGRRLLDELLNALSWELRTVFVMFEIEGLSSVEIAEALGVSRGTVASRLRIAREQFERGVQRHQARARAEESAPSLAARPASRWFA